MPWERCFGRATDRIRQERYISVNFKSVVSYGYSQRHIKNHLRTPCFMLAYKVNGTFTNFCFWNLLITNETGGCVLQNKPYFCRSCNIPAHEATSGNCKSKDAWSEVITDTEVNNCFSIYHTSWITSGPKSNLICENIATKAHCFSLAAQRWMVLG